MTKNVCDSMNHTRFPK